MNSPSDQDPPEGPKKRQRVVIPPAIRSELLHAIAENRQVHQGASGYDLLREDERFRPYIGKHLGETGDKRLDRLVLEVRAMEPVTHRGRRRRDDGRALDARTPDLRPSRGPAVDLTPDALAGRPQALRGFAEMEQELTEELRVLSVDIAHCRNPVTGRIVDPKVYLQLLAARARTRAARADLGDRFHAQLKNAHYYAAIHQVYADELADLPDRLARAKAGVGRVTADFGGLPPTSGEEP